MSDNSQKDLQQVVYCDMCLGEDRKPARKTCMKCEISMCIQHLQAHLTTPVLLQTHPLTEPMVLCGTTKCPLHGKLLEYYCLDDKTCLCVSCAIEDQHRLHNMKTFSTAHKELMEKLAAEQQALKGKTDDVNVSLEQWETSERGKLGLCSVRLIEAVTNLRDVALTSVQTSVSARMVAIKTSKSSMQAAQKEKDTFRFLQMYSQVHQDVEKAKAVDLRRGLEPGSDRDNLVEEIRQSGEMMVQQAEQFWFSLLTLVDPENHQKLIATDSDLIFDPQIWCPGMSLSRNKRMVFYSMTDQCFATLLITHPSIKSILNNRWVVNFSDDYDWTFGLCDKESAKDLTCGNVYGLCCKGNQLSFLTTEDVDCSVSNLQTITEQKRKRVSTKTVVTHCKNEEEDVTRPETVEMFWNFETSSLSFFSRPGYYQRKEILTIKMHFNPPDLVTFVKLGKQNVQNSQNRCCSCGVSRVNMFNSGTNQGICQCGKYIGCVTEVICELQ